MILIQKDFKTLQLNVNKVINGNLLHFLFGLGFCLTKGTWKGTRFPFHQFCSLVVQLFPTECLLTNCFSVQALQYLSVRYAVFQAVYNYWRAKVVSTVKIQHMVFLIQDCERSTYTFYLNAVTWLAVNICQTLFSHSLYLFICISEIFLYYFIQISQSHRK